MDRPHDMSRRRQWWQFIGGAAVFACFALPVTATLEAPVPRDRLRLTIEPITDDEGNTLSPVAEFFRHLRLRAVGVITPEPGSKFRVTAVAYSSTVSQTDLTPCITALGTRVRRGIIATNFLPLGTRVRIGDETYVVEDRMNKKYSGVYIIDIWHPTTAQAREFGVQALEVEILGEEPPPSPIRAEPPDEPEGFLARLRARGETVAAFVRRFLPLRAVIVEEEDCLTEPTPTPLP